VTFNNHQQQQIYRHNKQCVVNVNNLLGSGLIKLCKFCESVLLDDDEFLSRKQSDFNKAAQSSSATASSSINENNDNNEAWFYFCTKKCLNAFYKYLNLKNQKTHLSDLNDDHQYAGSSFTASSCSQIDSKTGITGSFL
jgi:hypothetical protein